MNAPSKKKPSAALVEYEGLFLPKLCPACGGAIDRELRFHAAGNHPAQLTINYGCGTVITTMQTMIEERMGQQTNVSAGCRVTTLKALNNGS